MPRFALLLAFLLLSLPAFAQDADPYTVTGIAVDVKGSNGSEARDKAFTDGGRLALAAVASKLSGGNPDFKAVDNNSITRMIKSFEVETEKASSTRYIATLTYHFKPKQTDAFLSARGMAVKDASEINADEEVKATAAATKVVVLPIVRTGDRSVLWEEHTDWGKAWENYLADHANTNFVVPGGEMDDINTISASEALAGIPGPLTRIMQRYEAQGVLVAVLSAPAITATSDKDMNVQLAMFDKAGAMRNTSSFNLAAAPQTKPMEWLQTGALTAMGKWQTVAEKIAAAPAKAAPDMTMTANGLQLAMNVPFSSPQQWQGIRSALAETNGISRLDVVSLTHAKATVLITYQGNRQAFENALADKGMRLQPAAAGGPPTLIAAGNGGATQAMPTTAMPPASTFRTVYPSPTAVPKDEVIYADPDQGAKSGDTSGDDNSSDSNDDGSVPPPPHTSKQLPPVPQRDVPLVP